MPAEQRLSLALFGVVHGVAMFAMERTRAYPFINLCNFLENLSGSNPVARLILSGFAYYGTAPTGCKDWRTGFILHTKGIVDETFLNGAGARQARKQKSGGSSLRRRLNLFIQYRLWRTSQNIGAGTASLGMPVSCLTCARHGVYRHSWQKAAIKAFAAD